MLVFSCLESFFYALNNSLISIKTGANDKGGTMTIHMFGAYFGLAASYFFNNKKSIGHKLNNSNYLSDLCSFCGTVFLYLYWPSFNACTHFYGS